MTQNERLLRIAGLMTLLRDDLEEINFTQKLKSVTNMWLKIANQKMDEMATGGDKSNEELISIVQKFDEILRLENIRP